MRILQDREQARASLLRRIPLEDMSIPEGVKKTIRRLFGQELTPAEAVERIIAEVRQQGDAALLRFTKALDGAKLSTLEVGLEEFRQAQVAPELAQALSLAAERIRAFHLRQRRRLRGWMDSSTGLGESLGPLDRVGLYIPGGTAAYPSTVLMSAIPARVAGVREIIAVSPPRADGSLPASVLVACRLAGVDRLFKVGGAQAIAALAYGTQSIPKVDKVCGPGGLFVTLAKKRVYGAVDIDGLYGPTETVLLADDSASPAAVAADLLAQAEHDPLASAILITTSLSLAQEVSREVERQLASLERREIAAQALEARGGAVIVGSLEEGLELANEYAPEHLCLMVREPRRYAGQVRHAGTVFLGAFSSEALGDYIAGPSHTNPTGGSARFSSPLNVRSFLKSTMLVALSREDSARLWRAAARIARAEGLTGHARALEAREEG